MMISSLARVLAVFYKLAVFSLISLSVPVIAAPNLDLWEIWQQSDETNIEVIDHSIWQEILQRHILSEESGINLFDYSSALAQSDAQLDSYLSQLSSIDPRTYSSAEQLAYWINLYNALTVDLILDNYPVDSITKLGGLFEFGPWDKELIEIAGESLTLNDIEHRILRPIWQDPRIHFAVNCASIGCPNLQAIAFTSENTEELMQISAIQYLSHVRGASFDERGRLQLSSIFDWYAEDFGDNQSQLLNSLGNYAPADLAERLRAYDGRIDYEYDWDLNDL